MALSLTLALAAAPKASRDHTCARSGVRCRSTRHPGSPAPPTPAGLRTSGRRLGSTALARRRPPAVRRLQKFDVVGCRPCQVRLPEFLVGARCRRSTPRCAPKHSGIVKRAVSEGLCLERPGETAERGLRPHSTQNERHADGHILHSNSLLPSERAKCAHISHTQVGVASETSRAFDGRRFINK